MGDSNKGTKRQDRLDPTDMTRGLFRVPYNNEQTNCRTGGWGLRPVPKTGFTFPAPFGKLVMWVGGWVQRNGGGGGGGVEKQPLVSADASVRHPSVRLHSAFRVVAAARAVLKEPTFLLAKDRP